MALAWLSALRFVWQNLGTALGIAFVQLLNAWIMLVLASGQVLEVVGCETILGGILLLGSIWLGSGLRAVTYAAEVCLVQNSPETRGVTLFQ